MTRLLVLAVGLASALSSANACDYMRSAKAQTVDPTVVASVSAAQPMSTAQTVIPVPGQSGRGVDVWTAE